MQHTMDTDYGLPIPMHRPFIDMTADFDTLLPFRKSLKQVTEISAENSMPYQLPTPRTHRSSKLEKLPLEIRHTVYGLFDDLWRCQPRSTIKRFDFRDYDCIWPLSLRRDNAESFGGGGSLLCVSRQIRAEIIDLMLRDAEVEFRHPLSNKKIFRNNWHKIYGADPNTPPKLERMRLASSTFHFIRHMRLESMESSRYAVEQPHSWDVSRKRKSYHVALLASSIRFVAKNCPNLVTLHFNPAHQSHPHTKGVSQAAFAPVLLALKKLVESCPNIEVVGMIGWTWRVCISTFGQQVATWDQREKQDHELILRDIPVYARGEAVEQWCKASVREIILHNEITEFVPWNEFAVGFEEKYGPGMESWSLKV